MTKISYLIGAGASRNALPIVSEIPEKLELFIQLLKDPAYILDKIPFEKIQAGGTKVELQLMLIDDFEWLLNLCKTHASIDTAAKKLYLKGNWGGLDRLKIALSIFLVAEQLHSKPDFRYDAFYASLLQDSIKNFPNNLRIISWNYDYQFELSFSDYTNNKTITLNQAFLNVMSKFDYDKKKKDNFTLYKLNGSTGVIQMGGFHQFLYIDDFTQPLGKETIEAFVRNYAAIIHPINQCSSSLSFAWEKQKDEKSIIPITIHGTQDTEVLVIIGYSFPFFNREVDRQIIGAMTQLRKVYFQAPDALNLIDRFKSIRPDLGSDSLIPIHDIGQFFLPPEL